MPSSPTSGPPAVRPTFVVADLGAGGRRGAPPGRTGYRSGGRADRHPGQQRRNAAHADADRRDLRRIAARCVRGQRVCTVPADGSCWRRRWSQRGEGAIVNIGSITGLRGGDGSAIYSANKAAVHSFTQSWAAEYGPFGVRVNAVAPGPIATERQAQFADHVAPLLARIPSRRMSTPAEVAAAVVFLASDDAANIHGAVLSVDGGWAAV